MDCDSDCFPIVDYELPRRMLLDFGQDAVHEIPMDGPVSPKGQLQDATS